MEKIFKNGVNISRMTLGTVQLGMSYGVNNISGVPSEEQSFKILDAAYDGGVAVLDTSDDYGRSEEVIGKYLKQNPDKHFEICTKFKVTDKSAEDIYGSLKRFAKASAERLSISRIPIFMSHTENNFLEYGDKLIKALNELKEEGLIINAGISLSNKDAFEQIIETGEFDAVQIPVNILDNKQIKNGLIKKASDAGITVFVRSVYLQGIFFKKREEFLKQNINWQNLKIDEMNKRILPVVERVRAAAEKHNMSVAQFAISFIKDTYGVDSLVLGSETAEQVKQNIKMIDAPAMPQDVLDEILEEFTGVDSFVISPWMWERRRN